MTRSKQRVFAFGKTILGLTLAAFGGGAAHAQGAAGPITATYQHRIKGYNGLQDATLFKKNPDESIGQQDYMMVGNIFDDKINIYKGLVRFTGLKLPKDAKIVSAKLMMFCPGFAGTPEITAYALLKPFKEGGKGGTAKPGETTWNSARHGETPWSAPGAEVGSPNFDFDGKADYHTPSEGTIQVKNAAWYTWDVTASFSEQWAKGKEYGWLLVETSGRPASYAAFHTREIAEQDVPVLNTPRLSVTYTLPSGAPRPTPASGPKLISFYLGETPTVAKDLKKLAKLPFDGAVFHGEDNRNLGSGEGSINLNVFGPERLDVKNYSRFIEYMRAIQRPPSRLTENFLRFNVVPGTLERKSERYNWENRPRRNEMITMWFSDFDAVVHNIRVAATVAKEAGMRGLLFDWEEYAGNVFEYTQLKDARDQGKSREETKKQVRQCAQRLARAIAETYPEMTFIIIPGIYSMPHSELETAFMDGFIEGSDPRTRLVDGHEKYWLASAGQFWDIYDTHYRKSPSLSAVPEKFLKQVEVGFGVHLDRFGWSKEPENIYSAARWQVKLENALTVADTYVWVFTGGSGTFSPDWWTGKYLPAAYIEATRHARDLARRMRGE